MAFSLEELFLYEVLFYIFIFLYFMYKSAHTSCSMELIVIFHHLRGSHACAHTHTHTHTRLGFNVLWGRSIDVMIFILYKLPLTENNSEFLDFQKIYVE